MITVRRDPQIKLPEIVTSLLAADASQVQNPTDTTQVKQTDVYGIICPLMALNGMVVDMPDILYFELDCTGVLPELEFSFKDRNNLFTQYNTPSTSNELQVQIIPPIDSTYKKVNMMFYVTEISAYNGVISGRATYKVPGLLHNRAHALGELTTYELCDMISAQSQLGFASNTTFTEDARYMYCDYSTYGDLLKKETENAQADETHVFDVWVDLWNYINICDVYERYNAIDEGDALTMWISSHTTIGTVTDNVNPILTQAVLSNHPVTERTELFVRGYEVKTDNQYVQQGTEKAVTVYNMNTKEYVGQYVADGDIERDKYINLEYGGEQYGDYDYIFAKHCRDMFMKKMKAEIVELTMPTPVFGLSRGDQCRFVWLDNDPRNRYWRDILEKAHATPELKDLNLGWLMPWIDSAVRYSEDSSLYVNLQVSGQYTVIGIRVIYEQGTWLYILQLARPAERKPILMDLNQNDNAADEQQLSFI